MQYQRRTPADAIAQMEAYQPPPDHPIMKCASEEYRQQYGRRRAFNPDWLQPAAALQTRIDPAALRAALKPIIRNHNRAAPLPILQTALIETDARGLHISYTDLETTISKTVPATYADLAPADFDQHLQSSPLAMEAQIISAGALCICPRTLDEIAANVASHGRSLLYMEAPADDTNTLRIRDYYGRFSLRGYSADEYPPCRRADAPDFHISADALYHMLKTTISSASRDQWRPILEGIAFIATPDALELAATDGSARFSQTLYTFDRLPDAEPWRATAPPALEATRVLPAKPLKKLMATLTPHIGGKQPIGIAMPRERHSLSFFMPDLTITIQALDGKPVQAQVEYFTQVSETAPALCAYPETILKALKPIKRGADECRLVCRAAPPGQPADLSIETGDFEASLDAYNLTGDPGQPFDVIINIAALEDTIAPYRSAGPKARRLPSLGVKLSLEYPHIVITPYDRRSAQPFIEEAITTATGDILWPATALTVETTTERRRREQRQAERRRLIERKHELQRNLPAYSPDDIPEILERYRHDINIKRNRIRQLGNETRAMHAEIMDARQRTLQEHDQPERIQAELDAIAAELGRRRELAPV